MTEARMKKCPECGREFEPVPNHPHQIYCSRKCGKRADNLKHHSKPEPRKCAACGAVFTPRNRTARYCSNACYYRAWVEAHRPKAEPRKCAHCGASFTPRRHDQRFCSRRCRLAHRCKGRRSISVRSPGAGVDRERVIAYLRLPDDERYARRHELSAAERILAGRIWNEWHRREEW